jgi:hypothetical protein
MKSQTAKGRVRIDREHVLYTSHTEAGAIRSILGKHPRESKTIHDGNLSHRLAVLLLYKTHHEDVAGATAVGGLPDKNLSSPARRFRT